MTNALSNPYELTLNGITCKTSPYGQGFYIDGGDIDKLGDKSDAFLKELTRIYDTDKILNPKTKALDAVKVYGRK